MPKEITMSIRPKESLFKSAYCPELNLFAQLKYSFQNARTGEWFYICRLEGQPADIKEQDMTILSKSQLENFVL